MTMTTTATARIKREFQRNCKIICKNKKGILDELQNYMQELKRISDELQHNMTFSPFFLMTHQEVDFSLLDLTLFSFLFCQKERQLSRPFWSLVA